MPHDDLEEGGRASQENKAGQKTKGKAECSTINGKVRQWSGVGEPGKASGGTYILYSTPWEGMEKA